MTERILVAACHGRRFWLAAGPWVQHIRRLDGCRVDLLALDGARELPGANVVEVDPGDTKLRWGVGERFQIEHIAEHLEAGRLGMHLDLDVRIKREFSKTLAALPYDFVVSRAWDFPEFAARQLGFVACLGFWLAKPSALSLVRRWLSEMQHSSAEAPDQDAFNRMLCLADAPRRDGVQFGNLYTSVHVFDFDGVSVAVLPYEAVMRDLDHRAIFANHDRSLFDHFIRRAALRHPLGAGRELVSTSRIGKMLISARDRRAAW